MSRRAVSFDCKGHSLCGIIHEPGTDCGDIGVLVVTGGPQYRIGSHRQFVQLSETLENSAIASMRFDHRGTGDSEGEPATFDSLDDDIGAAVDCFLKSCPAVRAVVIWGLCDAASAALIYAHKDDRVRGLVLLNPWVRQEVTEAQARLRNYYPQRLVSGAFWRRMLSGKVDLVSAVHSLFGRVRAASRSPTRVINFVERMLAGAQRFDGQSLVILSGDDLTAQEFSELSKSGPWLDWLQSPKTSVVRIEPANHTFSRSEWKEQVEQVTGDWIQALR